MSLYAIANIVDQFDNITHIRILDTASKIVKDIPYQVLVNVIAHNKTAIYNVEVVSGCLTGKGSSIKSFPVIKNNTLIGQAPATVVYKQDRVYTIANYKGIIVNVPEEKLIEYARLQGLTNGKIVNKGNKIVVSAKQGSFEGDTKPQVSQQTVSKEQKNQTISQSNTLPQNINENLSKFRLDTIEVIGMCMLVGEYEIAQARRSHEVLLIKSNDVVTYLPNIRVSEIRNISAKILGAIAVYIGRSISEDDLGKTIKTLIEESNKHIECCTVPSQMNFAIHDIRTILNNTQYKIGLLTVQRYLKMCIFNGNQFISDEICYIDNSKLIVAFKSDKKYRIIDINSNRSYQIDKVEKISEITSKYIISCHYGDIIVKDFNNKIVYREEEVYEYELLEDKFLVINSYSNKIVDLDTNRIIECKFANTCDNFIYRITKDKFVDRYGEHPLNEFPNLRWTGYKAVDFINKYSGFIPNPREIGVKGIKNLGKYRRMSSDYFMLRGLSEGIFSISNNKLENIMTHEIVDIDEVVMQWVLKNPRIGIIKNNKGSLLELLKQGKTLFNFNIKDEKLKYKGYDYKVDDRRLFMCQVQDIKLLDNYNIEIIIKDKQTGFRSFQVENK